MRRNAKHGRLRQPRPQSTPTPANHGLDADLSLPRTCLIGIPIGHMTGFAGFIDYATGFQQTVDILGVDGSQGLRSRILKVVRQLHEAVVAGVDPLLNLWLT